MNYIIDHNPQVIDYLGPEIDHIIGNAVDPANPRLEDLQQATFDAIRSSIQAEGLSPDEMRFRSLGLVALATEGMDRHNPTNAAPVIKSHVNEQAAIRARTGVLRLIAEAPELAEKLSKDGLIGFHGTTSAALPNILKTGITTNANLEEQGAVIGAGERSAGLGKAQRTLSLANLAGHAQQISKYSKANPQNVETLETKRSNFQAIIDALPADQSQDDVPNSLNRLLLPRRIADINSVVNHLKKDIPAQERVCIEENFGLIFGLNNKALAATEGIVLFHNDLSEFQLGNKDDDNHAVLPVSSIAVIFCPKDKLDLVKQLVKDRGLNTSVVPMSVYEAAYGNSR